MLDRRKTTPPDLLALSNMYFDQRRRIISGPSHRIIISTTNRQVNYLYLDTNASVSIDAFFGPYHTVALS